MLVSFNMLFSPTEYIDTLDSSRFPAAATASYVYYTVMGTLIMLNLLIALMYVHSCHKGFVSRLV